MDIIQHIWPAEKYHNNSNVQFDAALNLLHKIQLNNTNKILDVGCGDGKITAEIANRIPNGHVLGIDISKDMINFAMKNFPSLNYPNLAFRVYDAQNLDFISKFDVIFSSFSLQWFKNKNVFFSTAYTSLKPSGLMAITVPLDISYELEQAVFTIKNIPRWANYFLKFSPGWHFIDTDQYRKLLIEQNYLITYFNISPINIIFESRIDLENYIMPWFSYLNPIPLALKPVFFEAVINKYLDLAPINKEKNIQFSFNRLDILAYKIHK